MVSRQTLIDAAPVRSCGACLHNPRGLLVSWTRPTRPTRHFSSSFHLRFHRRHGPRTHAHQNLATSVQIERISPPACIGVYPNQGPPRYCDEQRLPGYPCMPSTGNTWTTQPHLNKICRHLIHQALWNGLSREPTSSAEEAPVATALASS